jgi:DNA topoisomerase IB
VKVREVDVADPGFGRRGAGKGFTYLDCEGRRITDKDVVARIKALAIPPAWTEVWICPEPHGHIQAMGYDARGRRQYRYHDQWRAERDQAKHDRMLELAARCRGCDAASGGTWRWRAWDGSACWPARCG